MTGLCSCFIFCVIVYVPYQDKVTLLVEIILR